MLLPRLRIACDTSALVSLEVSKLMDEVCKTFEVIIPEEVHFELKEITEFEDVHGKASENILKLIEGRKITVKEVIIKKEDLTFVDKGEAAALALAIKTNANYLVTDDCESFWYLAKRFKKTVFSAFVVKYLCNVGVLGEGESWAYVERMKEGRTWGENIIYKTAKKLWKR